MPEGLHMYACMLSDVFEHFTKAECFILCDITYGACCIDDIAADELDADLLIHYGHSCLVPINQTCVKCMYVFVDIFIDSEHLVKTIMFNFPDKESRLILVTVFISFRLFLMGTI